MHQWEHFQGGPLLSILSKCALQNGDSWASDWELQRWSWSKVWRCMLAVCYEQGRLSSMLEI